MEIGGLREAVVGVKSRDEEVSWAVGFAVPIPGVIKMSANNTVVKLDIDIQRPAYNVNNVYGIVVFRLQ